jgi:hypothetical protein
MVYGVEANRPLASFDMQKTTQGSLADANVVAPSCRIS